MGQGSDLVGVPPKRPTSGKVAKGLTGCGGCGCLFALTAMLAGILMLVWGSTDSKVDELIAPGAGVLALSVMVGFLALAVLIGGIVAMKKSRSASGPAPVAPVAPAAGPPAQDPGGAAQGGWPPQAPPGAPPPGPPPEW